MPTSDRQRNTHLPGADAPSHRKRWRAVVLLPLTLAGAGLGLLSLHPQAPVLVWNFTESVPLGLYSLKQGTPARGDLIAVQPAGDARTTLESYGALPAGRYLLKPLAGLAGDTVCRHGASVSINGKRAATARFQTSAGRHLPSWSGCQVLAENEILLLAPHPSSFDSRYFGPVTRPEIIGIADPIFTLPLSRETR